MLRIKTVVVGDYATNTYLIENTETKECVIVDPGDEAERIREAVAADEVTPKAILITHGHFDHVGALNEIRDFYKTECYANEAEKFFLKEYTIDRRLKDQEEFDLIGYHFKMLHTPGHSEGSCCYYIESEDLLFSGDTLFCTTYGRTDLNTGSFIMIKKSLDKLLMLPEDVKAFPGHGRWTTIGYERINNAILG